MIEPGYNIGISRRPALVSWYVTAFDKNGKQLFKLNSINAPGADFSGADFDSGLRIGESYAKGAKTLTKFLLKKKAFN